MMGERRGMPRLSCIEVTRKAAASQMNKEIIRNHILRRCLCPIAVWFAMGLAAPPSAVLAQSIEQKAQVCSACHGTSGVPQLKTTPAIWGQQLGYLYLQLRDFKSGARKSDQMGAVAASLERDDMMALATYFAQKPWPALAQPQASAAAAAQAVQATSAVVCTSCHQEGYNGDGTQPRLAGQERDYLAQTMLDFRSGARGNNPGMSDLMKSISESDIGSIADYLAGL